MSDFTKYQIEGAYHWVLVDAAWQNPRYNPPLVARYDLVARHIPQNLEAVLDVGCGDGYLLHLLGQRGARQVVGIDVGYVGVQLAQQKVGAAQVTCGSAYELPFENDYFAALTHADVIEHLQEPARAVAEMARVLKPGGMLVISTPNWHPQRPLSHFHVQEFKPQELKDLLTPHFRHVELIGAWAGWAWRRWSGGGRWRQVINTASRLGFNPFALTTHHITPDYEQLIAVCRK